jgi:hypothetical protein
VKSVGALEIRYLVNGHLLDRVAYPSEGEQVFERAVEADWLRAGANEVALELDKVYVANGVKLGVALAELGFTD